MKKIFFIAFIFLTTLLAFSATENFQSMQVSFNNETITVTDTGYSYTHPCAADFDGDGDIDFIVGTNLTNLIYYRNDDINRTDTTIDGTVITLVTRAIVNNIQDVSGNTLYGLKPAAGDIDGDGLIDLVVGNNDGDVYFLKNTGLVNGVPVFENQGKLIDASYVTASSPALVDMDGDGDLDLFIAYDNGRVDYYKNIGTATDYDFVLDISDVLNSEDTYDFATVTLADINNDGVYDILLGHKGNTLSYFTGTLTDGEPSFTKQTDSFGNLTFSEYTDPCTTDLENDGKIELLVGQINGNIAFFTDINGTITKITDMFCSVDFNANSTPLFIDIDNDGDEDLLLAYGGTVALLENTSTGGTINYDFKEMVFLSVPQFIVSMDTWDYDNDGDLDLFFGTSSGGVGLLENTGTSNGLPVYTLKYEGYGPYYYNDCFDKIHSPNPGAGICIGDFDGDGDMDFLIVDQYGMSEYYENKDIDIPNGDEIIDGWQAGNFVAVKTGENLSNSYFPFITSSFCSIEKKDIDGDGDWDFYFTGSDGKVYRIINNGTLSSPNYARDTTSLSGIVYDELSDYYINSKLSIADLNGDGWLEMVLGGKEGGIKFYANNMTADTTPPTNPDNFSAVALSESKIKLTWNKSTDLNGTGVKEYVVKRYNGGTLEATYHFANPVMTMFIDTGLTQETTYDYEIYAVDYAGNTSDVITVQEETGPPPTLDHFEITSPTGVVGKTFSLGLKAISNYGFVLDNFNETVDLAVSEGTITPTQITFTNGLATANITYSNDAATDNVQIVITVSYGTVSNDTNTISVDVLTPTTPTLLQATAESATSVQLLWNSVTDSGGAPSYYVDIYRNGTKIITVSGTSTSYTDNNCVANTTYTYYLKSRDSVGNTSPASNSITVTTPEPEIDTIPPTTPSGLQLVSTGETFIAFKWNPSTDEGGSGLGGYKIYRYNEEIATVDANTTSFTDTGLNPDTEYAYHVRAFDNSGNYSDYSDALVASTKPESGDTIAPSIPQNLTATTIDDSSIKLTWNASTDNLGGSGLAGYRIYREDVNDYGQAIAVVNASTTEYTDTNLQPGTTYRYKIKAYDNSGNISDFSNVAEATTTDTSIDTQSPSAPANVQVNAVSPSEAEITWDASTDNVAVSYYEVFQVTESSNPFQDYEYTLLGQTSELSFIQGDLTPGEEYTFTVRAVDTSGNKSRYSEFKSITMPEISNDDTPPFPPENLHFVTTTNEKIIIAFDPAQDNEGGSGVKQYIIFRNDEEIATTSTTSYEDTDIEEGQSYEYYVVAEDWNQNRSEPSNKISTIVPAEDNDPPSSPSDLNYQATPEYVVLTWGMSYDDGSGVDHYEIQKINSPFKTKEDVYAVTSATTFTDKDVTVGATYIYSITAVDRAGNKSIPSSVTVTIPESGSIDHTLYFPHIDVTDFWWTGFAVVNPGETTANIVFKFYDNDGNEVASKNETIEPKGKIVATIREFFNNEVPEGASWYKIESDTKIDGFELFGTKDWHEMVGVKIFSNPSTKLIYPEIKSDDNFWTGIVLINIDDSAASVTFKAYNANGEEIASSNAFTLASNGKKVALVQDLFDSFPEETAYIVAESDKNLIGFELYGYNTHVGLAGLSALPLEDAEEDTATTKEVYDTYTETKATDSKTLSAIVLSATEVHLMWDPVDPAPDSYRIYEVEVTSTPFGDTIDQVKLWGETTNTEYIVSGLTPDTDYTFAVYPVYNGDEGTPTNTVTVHTLAGAPNEIYTYVCPRIEELEGGETSIAMINTGSDNAEIKVQLLGDGAEKLAETTVTLSTMNKVENKLSELFDSIPDNAKAVRVISDQKLIVWENFENNCQNGDNDGYYDTLYAFDRALNEVNFTHIAPETNMWDSYVAVWNLEDYGNMTKFNAYGIDGSVLGVFQHDILPGDVISGEIHDFIPDDNLLQNIGWVQVTGEHPMNGYFAFSNKEKTLLGAIEGQ